MYLHIDVQRESRRKCGPSGFFFILLLVSDGFEVQDLIREDQVFAGHLYWSK